MSEFKKPQCDHQKRRPEGPLQIITTNASSPPFETTVDDHDDLPSEHLKEIMIRGHNCSCQGDKRDYDGAKITTPQQARSRDVPSTWRSSPVSSGV